MKPLFILLVSIILSSDPACSQDTINMRSGLSISAKILMVNDQNIIYKKYGNLNGPDYTTPKTDVITIKYENGTIDSFSVNSQDETTNALPRNEYYFIKGREDAIKHYHGYKTASTATLITSLFSPFVGLVPAIACSSTKPKKVNLDYPNADLIVNRDYYDSYLTKAHKIKQGKVWTNWGIAFGVNIVLVLVITASY